MDFTSKDLTTKSITITYSWCGQQFQYEFVPGAPTVAYKHCYVGDERLIYAVQ